MDQYPPLQAAPASYVESLRSANAPAALKLTKSSQSAAHPADGTRQVFTSFDIWQKRNGRSVLYRGYRGSKAWFWPLKPVFVGDVQESASTSTGKKNPYAFFGTDVETANGARNPTAYTGTWLNTAEPSNLAWATSAGATAEIAATAVAGKLVLKSYQNISGSPDCTAQVLDGVDVVATFAFSCYSYDPPEKGVVYYTIASGLEEKAYRVILTNNSTVGKRMYVHLGYVQNGIRYPETVGSFIMSSPWVGTAEPSNLCYVAQTGAGCRIQMTSPANRLIFKTFTDAYGGDAKAEIYDSSDALIQTFAFSCHYTPGPGQPSGKQIYITLADGIPSDVYKVVLTSLSPGRLYVHLGYTQGVPSVRYPGTIESQVLQDVPASFSNDPISPYNGAWNLGRYSNKEFAFRLRKANQPAQTGSQWVPDHGPTNATPLTDGGTTYPANTLCTEFLADPIRAWADGVEVDLTEMYLGETVEAVEKIETQQHFFGRNLLCDTPFLPLVEVWMTTTYLSDGAVEFRGRILACKEVIIETGYPLMLMSARRDGQFLYSSWGGRYPASQISPTTLPATVLDHGETGRCSSYMFAASQLPRAAVALDIIDPASVLRPSEIDRGQAFMVRQGVSQNYEQKVYDMAFQEKLVPAGWTYGWSGRYICAETDADPVRQALAGPQYPPFGTSAGPNPPADTVAGSLPATLSFVHAGEEKDLAVTAIGPWHLTVEGTGFSGTVYGYGSGSIPVTAAANSGTARTGTARLVCGKTLTTTTLQQE